MEGMRHGADVLMMGIHVEDNLVEGNPGEGKLQVLQGTLEVDNTLAVDMHQVLKGILAVDMQQVLKGILAVDLVGGMDILNQMHVQSWKKNPSQKCHHFHHPLQFYEVPTELKETKNESHAKIQALEYFKSFR